MKKNLVTAVALIAVFLIILIPFASSDPDGLEKAAEDMGVTEQEPAWKGLMPDYALEAIGNPYFATLAAGILGTLLVLGLSLFLGNAVDSKKKTAQKAVKRV